METILAQFVTWNNVINDYAVNVQNLLAPALGAMVAEVCIGRNVDAVQLDLVTPFNKQRASPPHHLMVEWMKNQELREADAALAQARLSLMDFLEAQAEAAATAGRTAAAGGASGRGGTASALVLEVPRLARLDTSGAATLALLTEATTLPGLQPSGGGGTGSPGAPSGSAGGNDRNSAGRAPAATPEAASLARRSDADGAGTGSVAGGQLLGTDGLPSGPGRPPGTAESTSTDASDVAEAPQTLTQHLQHFNGCVASLQQHLGPNFGVYWHITPAACAVKGRCAFVRLMRHPQPAALAAAVSAGGGPAPDPRVEHLKQQQQLKARLSMRLSRGGGSGGVSGVTAAAAAAAAAATLPPQPSAVSRGPSRVTSQASLGRNAGVTLRAAAAAQDAPPPPPGSAAAIFGEEAVPVTLVDLVYSGIPDAILRAERSVAVVGNELARLFEKYEPPLSLVEEPKHCRKLKTLPVAKEYVEANRKIQQLNAVLFKLAKAVAKTAWIYSTPLCLPDDNLGDVARMVCEAIRRVADTTWLMCKRHLESVHLVTLLTHHEPFTIMPRFLNDDVTFRFELDVVVDQALLMSKGFPDLLPPQMRAVWDSLLALGAVVQESRVRLAPLRLQYKKLHEEVREFYTMAPEAAKARRLTIAEAANVARVVNGNLAAIFEAEQVFETYSRNVQRIVDAYARAQRDIRADLQLKLAELTTKLPRSIVKPSFSAEMLQLMRASVNPTELAATMTLALTANNMDPAALALMQQTLAASAMGNQQAQGQAQAPCAIPAPVNPAAAGGGAVAALGGVGILQQQQQQLQAQMLQVAATGAHNLNGTVPAATGAAPPVSAAASRRGLAVPAAAIDVPELVAHGTAADYAAQLAMAQAYGYAYSNPHAAYGTYGSGTLGSISMGAKSSHDLAAALAGAAMGGPLSTAAVPVAVNGRSAAATAVPSTAAAAAPAAGLPGAYQSAGYDSNTIAMLAQMGYGGFAVGASPAQQQQHVRQAQPQ